MTRQNYRSEKKLLVENAHTQFQLRFIFGLTLHKKMSSSDYGENADKPQRKLASHSELHIRR